MIKLYSRLYNNKKLAVTLACLCTAFIFIACLYPSTGQSRINIPHFDKLVHCIAFAGFSGSWACTLSRPTLYKYLILLLITVAVGSIIEVLQESSITYGRSFEYADIIADSIGGLLGILFHHFLHCRYKRL